MISVRCLSGILESNIMVISQKGKILGAAVYSGIDKIGELNNC